ncbi:anthranilate synthase component I [Capsaspora owczarzaki ATCC 30864]|uniref:anthranilate synthase n=1 Tax=Capsaspora owczarzaki (strain ATCC 30864) TaxID=595528 RepID=A0A0D2X229_CAPO3|nr:anthranilate synthase component I [Capsaspora owczarzaki ATCC 30864]KJE91839.1 anthranilate synthase component I [Capsaspora owczarzaki ATCC 30864]|eukprot:XP_004363753.1 anthranilate synthase component I [Capsaspora owczarzaki ATCC 30864]
MSHSPVFRPSFEEVQELSSRGNMIPVYAEAFLDLITPVAAYLKLCLDQEYAFLLESVAGGEKLARYSFLGVNPYRVAKVGAGHEFTGDPLKPVEQELAKYKFVPIPGLPMFTGGAIGYISFDCVHSFEPHTAQPLQDNLPFLPEAIFMYCDTIVVFDHLRHQLRVVGHVRVPTSNHPEDLRSAYNSATQTVRQTLAQLCRVDTPVPVQGPIVLGNVAQSNQGQQGYERIVRDLKTHINKGDIIQAVPSQRLSRPTSLHPFNLYRHLRSINPSPYMFFIQLGEVSLVGASPEMLVKVDENNLVETHPIAGTRRRGKTPAEDDLLAAELLADEKERAEHIMLVDLGRNDMNRVCQPRSVKVPSLMHIERYSHVMHIVSTVTGTLRSEITPLDAFRSIFPAGTVSGAPKVRAVQLIQAQEQERRGVYAGSVGYFTYGGQLDTCIAIRTIVMHKGVAYLQAGAGIVFDSDPTSEYEETISKLNSSIAAIAQAERFYFDQQQQQQQQQ